MENKLLDILEFGGVNYVITGATYNLDSDDLKEALEKAINEFIEKCKIDADFSIKYSSTKEKVYTYETKYDEKHSIVFYDVYFSLNPIKNTERIRMRKKLVHNLKSNEDIITMSTRKELKERYIIRLNQIEENSFIIKAKFEFEKLGGKNHDF